MKALFPLLAMIACCVAANLLMKLGSEAAPSPLLLGLMSWRTVYGLIAFGCGGLFYAVVLHFLPLNVAQSLAAAQFIAVIIASKLVLGEPIDFGRWIGISMIAAGIIVVASSEMQ
jgi:undecaprenyl phosphate-alpha-L-ara4N flippase subunit ArnE